MAVIQNYSQEKRLIYEEFQRKVNEFERASPAKKQAAGSATTRDELEEVAQKIRATKLGYKEMKEFLGQLLPELCPEQVDGEGSKMGRLLQVWPTEFSIRYFLVMAFFLHDRPYGATSSTLAASRTCKYPTWTSTWMRPTSTSSFRTPLPKFIRRTEIGSDSST